MIASFCSPPCAVGSEGGGRAEGSLWQARRDLQWRGWRQLLPAQHSEGALVTLQAPPPPSAGTWDFPLWQRWEIPLFLAVSVWWVFLLHLAGQGRQSGEWE